MGVLDDSALRVIDRNRGVILRTFGCLGMQVLCGYLGWHKGLEKSLLTDVPSNARVPKLRSLESWIQECSSLCLRSVEARRCWEDERTV